MRHPHPHSDGRFAGPRFDTTDPTAPRGRNRRRRGDFPDAPYEEGFDPRRGGPRGAFPHEHHEHGGHSDFRGRGGFGPGGPRGFGGPGFGGGPGGRGPGRRAGRGDIRAAILLLLAEEPMHGYQLIQQIGERSGGTWRPSPGAIYPALNLLEDEGLIAITSE
ncbi:MAG: PadR family transcriptional regulator, partial [Cellulomonas sp.]